MNRFRYRVCLNDPKPGSITQRAPFDGVFFFNDQTNRHRAESNCFHVRPGSQLNSMYYSRLCLFENEVIL